MDERVEKKAYRKARKLDEARKANRDRFVVAALNTIEGRDYFFWLLELCHVGAQPFVNNALLTAFQCGELNIGQQVQANIIDVSPSNFLKMLKEKEEERKYAAGPTTTGQPDFFDAASADDDSDEYAVP